MPLLFGTDDDLFSLESMAKTAEALKNLPDDGNIRMIQHGSGYHSHKYGYAVDGMDFWLNAGRVMDRERYLELMRLKEEALLKGLEETSIVAGGEPECGEARNRHFIEIAYDGSGVGKMEYKTIFLIDALVITPTFLVSFPRAGLFDCHEGNKAWTAKTNFSSSKGILRFYGTPIQDESPFKIYFRTNCLASNFKNSSEFQKQSEQITNNLSQGIDEIREITPLMEMYVARLNNLNNVAFFKNINNRKMREAKVSV